MLKFGIQPTLDQVIWLNDLCREVENPSGGRPTMAIGTPVCVGNAWLWPFTIQASAWYEESLLWFDGELATYALGYALCKGREPEAFAKMYDRDYATDTLKKWCRGLDCTLDELAWGIGKILEDKTRIDDPDADSTEGASGNWDDLITTLCGMTKTEPEIWTTFCCRDFCLKMIHASISQNQAGGSGPDPNDPHILATQRMLHGLKIIRDSHKEQQSHG